MEQESICLQLTQNILEIEYQFQRLDYYNPAKSNKLSDMIKQLKPQLLQYYILLYFNLY